MHGHALQLLLFPAPVYTTLGEPDGEQGAVGGFFSRGGLGRQPDGAPFLEVARHLVPDILLEAADDQPFVAVVPGV